MVSRSNHDFFRFWIQFNLRFVFGRILYSIVLTYLIYYSFRGGETMNEESKAGVLTIGGIFTNGIQIGLKMPPLWSAR